MLQRLALLTVQRAPPLEGVGKRARCCSASLSSPFNAHRRYRRRCALCALRCLPRSSSTAAPPRPQHKREEPAVPGVGASNVLCTRCRCAWSVGVLGRSGCCTVEHSAMNASGASAVAGAPLSETADKTGVSSLPGSSPAPGRPSTAPMRSSASRASQNAVWVWVAVSGQADQGPDQRSRCPGLGGGLWSSRPRTRSTITLSGSGWRSLVKPTKDQIDDHAVWVWVAVSSADTSATIHPRGAGSMTAEQFGAAARRPKRVTSIRPVGARQQSGAPDRPTQQPQQRPRPATATLAQQSGAPDPADAAHRR